MVKWIFLNLVLLITGLKNNVRTATTLAIIDYISRYSNDNTISDYISRYSNDNTISDYVNRYSNDNNISDYVSRYSNDNTISDYGPYIPSETEVLIKKAPEMQRIVPPNRPIVQENIPSTYILNGQNISFRQQELLTEDSFHYSFAPTNP
ncbi:hypothetical protein G9A89_003910 [Geosiphon pyriformis]|nr:hypothetical protein G9A89_003910 [Geosiphon pyriformis]